MPRWSANVAVAGRRPAGRGSEDAERRAAPRARRTCARATRSAGAGSACARPSEPLASSTWSATIVCTIRRRIRGSASSSTEAAAEAASDARSSSSPGCGAIAAASASTSPGGTSRPFSPSSTTSGIPPTDVAITGVPAASASSRVCGRFSHADVRSAASAARKSAITSSREPGPEEARRARRRRARRHVARARPLRARRRGRAAATSGTRASAASASPRAFCAREATGGAERQSVEPERGARLVACRGAPARSGAGFGTTDTRSAVEAPAERDRAQVGARDDDATSRGGARALRVARRSRARGPPRYALELLERAGEAPRRAARARTPRRRRASRRAAAARAPRRERARRIIVVA